MAVKVGFSGTQKGMTKSQAEAFRGLLIELYDDYEGISEFHHGDCIGADAEAHEYVLTALGYYATTIVVHPPSNPKKRAFCKGGEMRPAKPYLTRNGDIVKDTQILIATPGEKTEQLRSGTWSTVRFAVNNARTVYLVYTNGRVMRRGRTRQGVDLEQIDSR